MSRVDEVLKQLYAQRKLKLRFESRQDREDFRQRLYKYKRVQDAAAFAVLDEDKQVLRCKLEDFDVNDNVGKFTDFNATFWLEDKKEISFEIISIEDTPVKESHGGNEKKISAHLGEADSGAIEDSPSENNLGIDDAQNPKGNLEGEGLR